MSISSSFSAPSILTSPKRRVLNSHDAVDVPNYPGVAEKKFELDADIPLDEGEIVAILDAGAQYGKVIDRRVRDLSVLTDILPFNTPASELTKYKALILSGGPQSVYGDNAPKYDPAIFKLGKPILGICYGMQLINFVHGGKIERTNIREDGQFFIDVTSPSSELFNGLPKRFEVLLTHGDSVTALAPGFVQSATSVSGTVAAIENPAIKVYGVQFHPEVDLSQHGQDIFRHFLFRVCKCKGSYTMANRKELAIKEIRDTVKDKKVLVLVSGGVDSTVCSALLLQALPAERIFALHVDHGFMRLDESRQVADALAHMGLNMKVVDASKAFAHSTTSIDSSESEELCATVAPEVKRKIIGDTFMRVSEEHIRTFGLNPEEVYLAQGTLRPDLIESASKLASGHADVIKTHHNDTQLVRRLRDLGRIVEPLKDYHKDEVRALGTSLGLSDELVWRQPFPGPGLAIRILCAVEPYITADDDNIVNALKEHTSDSVNATLLPCRTVGVQGDCRSYSNLVGLSGASSDPTGLKSESIDWATLIATAKAIPKKLHKVNRVAFVFGEPLKTGKLTTITPTKLTEDVVKQLQKADAIVNKVLFNYRLVKALSQVPVILFPVDFGESGKRAICIRTFITHDFMTGVPACPGIELPFAALNEMVQGILSQVEGIARVCYDLTGKPPGTTEWE